MLLDLKPLIVLGVEHRKVAKLVQHLLDAAEHHDFVSEGEHGLPAAWLRDPHFLSLPLVHLLPGNKLGVENPEVVELAAVSTLAAKHEHLVLNQHT